MTKVVEVELIGGLGLPYAPARKQGCSTPA
jgi:hypothetical protein